jgi:hypothetical protein
MATMWQHPDTHLSRQNCYAALVKGLGKGSLRDMSSPIMALQEAKLSMKQFIINILFISFPYIFGSLL